MPRKPIPTLPGLPVVGHLFAFSKDRLAHLLRVSRECGDIGRFYIGPKAIVLANSSEYAQQLLVEHANDFEKTPIGRAIMRPLLGNGLLISEHEYHRRQRKLIAPIFQHRHIAGYAGIMADCAELGQQPWQDGAVVDLSQEMMRMTLHVVGQTLFGTDVLGEADDISQAVTVALNCINDIMKSVVRFPRTWPTPRNQRYRKAVERLDATIYQMMEVQRASAEERSDLFSLLLRMQDETTGRQVSDQQLRDEAINIFLAGHETVSNALTWAFYLLTQHPDVYSRMRTEVDGVLAGRAPTLADLPNLPYALQVFKEAMRLYPPVHMLARGAVRAVELGSYHLPAKTVLIISPYTMHRRPDYFPDPERFNPERFTPEAEQRLPRYAYLPFGGGPRVCIGNHFALMEGQILLAALVQRVTFELVPGQSIELEPLLSLRPRYGIKMKVRRRDTLEAPVQATYLSQESRP